MEEALVDGVEDIEYDAGPVAVIYTQPTMLGRACAMPFARARLQS